MPLVLVVQSDAGIRARVLDALARGGVEARAQDDLESALDHPEVADVRVVLADPVLLEQYEFDFRTQINVRAGSEIAVIALVSMADPARKKSLARHEASLLDRPIEDEAALLAQVSKHLAAASTVPQQPEKSTTGLGRMKVERINLDGDALNAPVGPDQAQPMVLVVDDQEDARSFFATLLEQRGYRVHAVSSASSALRFLTKEAGAVHLIVSDIDMPVMDGFELKFALKESSIPFIAVAGDDSNERKRLAKELGMVALVGKPIQVKPFCELVRGTLLAGAPK